MHVLSELLIGCPKTVLVCGYSAEVHFVAKINRNFITIMFYLL